MEQGRRQITKEIGQLDQHLASSGPYVTGTTFTVGDIPIGLVVNWAILGLTSSVFTLSPQTSA